MYAKWVFRCSYKKRDVQTNISEKLGYKDSNLEMTESESVALPFGDSPMSQHNVFYTNFFKNASTFFKLFQLFLEKVLFYMLLIYLFNAIILATGKILDRSYYAK